MTNHTVDHEYAVYARFPTAPQQKWYVDLTKPDSVPDRSKLYFQPFHWVLEADTLTNKWMQYEQALKWHRLVSRYTRAVEVTLEKRSKV